MNKIIFITGCQRSGTTLLSLMLDSHQKIRSVDELDFDDKKLGEYFHHPAYSPCVAFKQPSFAHILTPLKMPQLKALWCVRDPRDVILSMINLKLNVAGHNTIWANHPLGAVREVENCMKVLGYSSGTRSFFGIEEYQRIRQIPFSARNRKDGVFVAALCWKLKNELLTLYVKENIKHMVVYYEQLIVNPKSTMEQVLSFLNLPWDNQVLQHHLLHNGTSVGNTINNKPIDASNMGKWKNSLRIDELATIELLCSEVAYKFHYQLSGVDM